MFRLKPHVVYTTAIATLAVLIFGAFFLNLLPWTSSAPIDVGAAAGNDPPVNPDISPSVPEPEFPEDEIILFEGNMNRLPAERVFELLDFLELPLTGARIQMTNGQLPGAPRSYRNGTHQGVDFYNGFTGIVIEKGTPVLAAAEGKVIRIDHTYVEMTAPERAEYRRISMEAETTPEDILDKFRGRQVWLEHQGNVITRYAHLDTVNAELNVGDTVQKGHAIGTVGNSGTPPAITGGTGEMHLHFEIWVNGFYLGEGLPAEDVRFLLKGIFE
jgi:murein DD-endopeptidase MepM/ murein hydrolase activator NlpD